MGNELIIEALNNILELFKGVVCHRDNREYFNQLEQTINTLNDSQHAKYLIDQIDALRWVLSLIDEPGNTSGDVKQAIHEKIFTFEGKKDGGKG